MNHPGTLDLLDLSVDGLVIIDDQGVVRFANPAARDLLGSESVGAPFDFPLADQEAVLHLPDTGTGSRAVAVRAWPGEWEGGAATLASIRSMSPKAMAPAGESVAHPSGDDPLPKPAATPDRVASQRQRRILVVEDQARIRRLVTRVLTSEGFAVIEAEDADAALARLEEVGDDIDLLLTDVVMPGLSGPELAEKVRSMRPELRVLFMSGYTNGYLSDAGDDVGKAVPSERFLQKPFSVEQLLDRIEHVIGR